MKKIFKIVALASIFAVTGFAFAQETSSSESEAAVEETTSEEASSSDEAVEEEATAEEAPAKEEPQPVLNVTGSVYTGLTANFNDSTLSLLNNDSGNNRLRLNLNYSYGNVGVRARAEFKGTKWATSYTASATTTSVSASYGENLPQLIYAFGYADLFNDKLSIEAGRFFTNPFGPNLLGYGTYGQGVSAAVNFTDELSAGAVFYVPASFTKEVTFPEFFYDSVLYGVSYSGDVVSASLAYGYESLTGSSDTVLLSVNASQIAKVLDITSEFELFDAFLGETRTLDSALIFDVAIPGVDPLAIEFSVADELSFGSEVENAYTYLELLVDYDIEAVAGLTAEIAGGYELVNGGYYVRPGVKYALGKKATVGLHYAYTSGDASYIQTSGGEGNELQLDFVWNF